MQVWLAPATFQASCFSPVGAASSGVGPPCTKVAFCTRALTHRLIAWLSIDLGSPEVSYRGLSSTNPLIPLCHLRQSGLSNSDDQESHSCLFSNLYLEPWSWFPNFYQSLLIISRQNQLIKDLATWGFRQRMDRIYLRALDFTLQSL